MKRYFIGAVSAAVMGILGAVAFRQTAAGLWVLVVVGIPAACFASAIWNIVQEDKEWIQRKK